MDSRCTFLRSWGSFLVIDAFVCHGDQSTVLWVTACVHCIPDLHKTNRTELFSGRNRGGVLFPDRHALAPRSLALTYIAAFSVLHFGGDSERGLGKMLLDADSGFRRGVFESLSKPPSPPRDAPACFGSTPGTQISTLGSHVGDFETKTQNRL
jgi:hypothetical protein